MSVKPLDAFGVSGDVGKADFQPVGPIVHGTALKRRAPESKDRCYAERISELVLTQSQFVKVAAERDALIAAMERIADICGGEAARIARETLARLVRG